MKTVEELVYLTLAPQELRDQCGGEGVEEWVGVCPLKAGDFTGSEDLI